MDQLAINYEKFRPSYHDPDMIFGFLEEEEEEDFPVSFYESSIDRVSIDEDDDEKISNADERKSFWESQEEFLRATLYRTTSFEARVRRAAKDALKELNSVGLHCSCHRTAAAAANCRRCRQKEMSAQLQNAGFNSVICMSNWKSSPEIPAGQHSYLEVVQSSESSKKGDVKVIIELNFRAEFEMARSCQEYKQLVAKLPELFVGKVERLRNLVKILCAASKKCMEERKMYMAPWRKLKYMQAKWQGTPLPQAVPPSMAVGRPKAPPKQRASMLTFDFVDTLHHHKAVAVI